MITRVVTLLSIFCVLIYSAYSQPSAANNVSLANLHYNYVVNVDIGGYALNGLIVDTGNSAVTILSSPFNTTFDLSAEKQRCTTLWEDDSPVYLYTSLGSKDCYKVVNQTATLGTVTVRDDYVSYQYFSAYNDKLHNWNESYGGIGLAYEYTDEEVTLPSTTFQKLLAELPAYPYSSSLPSSPYVFGLNFNVNGREDSSMQLGHILPQFANKTTWMPQMTETPVYHTFFINNLEICGQDLFGNYSTNWPVLVDTGSVCLTLPAEFYDVFVTWFNVKNNIGSTQSVDDLPVFKFSLFAQNFSSSNSFSNIDSDDIFLHLASLLVNSSVFMGETYPSFSSDLSFCILRGSEIGDLNKNNGLERPYIVFGTQVLHSFYVAADFKSKVVGLAIKNSSQELNANLNAPGQGYCASRKTCMGAQIYNPAENSCKDFDCTLFFFMESDPSTKTCKFTSGAVFVGIFFLVIVTTIEVFYYFVLQYTTYESIDRNQDANGFMISNLNPFSVFLGRHLSKIVDLVVVKVLHWDDNPERRHRDNIEGGDLFNNQELAPFNDELGNNPNNINNTVFDEDENPTPAVGGRRGVAATRDSNRNNNNNSNNNNSNNNNNNNNSSNFNNNTSPTANRRIVVLQDDEEEEEDDDIVRGGRAQTGGGRPYNNIRL